MVKSSAGSNEELDLDGLDSLMKARALFKESSRDIMRMAREFCEAVGGEGEATFSPDSENAMRAPIGYMCLNFAYNLWCQTVVPTIRASQSKFQPEPPPQQNIFPLGGLLGGYAMQVPPKHSKEDKGETKEEPKGEDHGEREAETPED